MTQPIPPEDETPKSGALPIDNKVWKAYLAKMTGWAMRAMRHVKETTGDVNDVVASALRTHLRRQEEGIEPAPENTKQLWEQLRKHLNRKIDKYRQAQRYLKNRAVRQADMSAEAEAALWELGCIDDNPTPEQLEAFVREAMQLIDAAITDPELREIARLTLMSYTPAEIGEQMELSVHQVRRRLTELRTQLQQYLDGQQ